jgi:hypothetical protein
MTIDRSDPDTHLERGYQALLAAGMPQNSSHVAMGHSLGAIIAYTESLDGLAEGLVLLGATVYDREYEACPLDVLVINGDLDGQLVIHTVIHDFR